MRTTLLCTILMALVFTVKGEGIIDDFQNEIAALDEGDQIVLEYTFEGCYGPYHHGSISVVKKAGKLEYLTKSFNHKNVEGLSQAGKYEPEQLQELLIQAKNKTSSTVFGNAISYRLSDGKDEILRGADRIEQRHFIELFEPFTSIFKEDQKSIIPKVSSGGFVN